VVVFVFGDFLAQGFGGAFHLFRIHGYTGQFLQQFTALLKADHGPDGARHACECGREGSVLDAQMSIAGKGTVAASRAVIIRTLQPQRTEHAVKLLTPASEKMCLPTTAAGNTRAHFIGGVGIDSLFNRAGSEPQRALAQGHLQSLEIQLRDSFPT